MPVPAEIRRVERHDDDVADAGDDVLVAARAQIVLGRLVRVQDADLHLADASQRGIRAHKINSAATTKAAATYT